MSEIECRLARILIARGNYGEAASLLRRSIAMLEQATGPDDANLVHPLHLLGRCLWRTGERGEAFVNLARGVNLAKAAFAAAGLPEQASFRASCQDELDLIQGDAEVVSQNLRESLARSAERGRPVADPEEMPRWEILGEAEEAAGRLDAAREAYLRAVAEWEKLLSPGHPRSDWARAHAARLENRQAA